MAVMPLIVGAYLIIMGSAIKNYRGLAIEKWVGYNVIWCGILLIGEYIASLIITSISPQMPAIYCVTTILVILIIILGYSNSKTG